MPNKGAKNAPVDISSPSFGKNRLWIRKTSDPSDIENSNRSSLLKSLKSAPALTGNHEEKAEITEDLEAENDSFRDIRIYIIKPTACVKIKFILLHNFGQFDDSKYLSEDIP